MRALAAMTLTVLFACGAVTSKAAQEPPLLVAVDKCPAKAACIVVDIHVPANELDPARIVGPWKSDCGGKIYRVSGRLRGSAVRSYRLALQGACMGDCAEGNAAYYGRSARNAPVIATNLGRFEIVDKGVEVGVGADLIVIDEAKGTVAQYLGNYAGSGDYFVERNRVYMRHDEGAVCVTAPQARPGFLGAAAPQHCRDAQTDARQPVEFKDLTPQSRAFLDRFFATQKSPRTAEEMTRDRIRRLGGLVLVQPNDNCYR